MSLLTLPLGLEQSDGWGHLPQPSAMKTMLHGVMSWVPAYREAYAQQERKMKKNEEVNDDAGELTDIDLILPEDRWRYVSSLSYYL